MPGSPGGFDGRLRAVRDHMAELSVRARGGWGSDLVSKEQARALVDELEALDREVTALIAERASEAEAVEAAEREGARYRDLFALAPDPYFVTDDSGLILDANRAAVDVLRLDPASGTREPLSQHVSPSDRHRFRAWVGRMRQNGASRVWEMGVGPVDGPWTTVAAHATSVHDARGRVAGFRWSLRDVTLFRRERETSEAAAAEQADALDHLRSTLELHDVVLRGLAHDARTPLATVIGLSHLLQRERDSFTSDRLEWALAAMYDNSRRVDHLLNDLVEVHRLSMTPSATRRRPTDLRAAAERAVTACDLGGRTVGVEGVSTKVAVPAGVIERIVIALLDNVGQHTPVETVVVVRVGREPGAGLVTVEDDGPGVPLEAREVVFEPFKRAPTSRETAGAGIGLYVVAKLAGLYGGRAWLEDSPTGGASVAVRLPAG